MKKRIANPYYHTLQRVFDLRMPVYLYSVDDLVHTTDGYPCEALYHFPGHLGENQNTHVILINSKNLNTMPIFLECVAHEYVHCWQEENGFELKHNESSQYQKWKRYLKRYYFLNI